MDRESPKTANENARAVEAACAAALTEPTISANVARCALTTALHALFTSCLRCKIEFRLSRWPSRPTVRENLIENTV